MKTPTLIPARLLLSWACCLILLPAAASAASDAAPAADQTLAAVSTNLTAFMAENGWSVADLADAVRSLRALYVRDTATSTGRARWHGKLVLKVTDPDALTVTSTYEDGETFVDSITAKRAEAIATRATAIPRSATVATNGLPAAVAAARVARANRTVITNTVNLILN